MKKLMAVIMLVLLLSGCFSSTVVFKKGDVVTLDTPISEKDFDVVLNDMKLEGGKLIFNVTIRNHNDEPLEVDDLKFEAVGFYLAEKQFSNARLAEGESVTGDCVIKERDPQEKGKHSIQVTDTGYVFLAFDSFDYEIK